MRHQASGKFSQQAPVGMKMCCPRGLAASQSWIGGLVWLLRLSLLRRSAPVGFAAASASRCSSYPAVLRARVVRVVAWPSRTRNAP